MFFWVSVGSTADWSPSVCAGAKSPRSDDDTLRSMISWRGLSRTIRTTRLSALPYRLLPNTAMRCTLAADKPGDDRPRRLEHSGEP